MDPNLAAVSGNCEGVKFISAHDERISLHGVYFDETEGIYRRVPEEVQNFQANIWLHLAK